MRHHRTLQQGFSLVEVLITVGVLAVGLVAMARFQGTVLQGSSFAKERSEAVALAEQKIEQMRNYRDVVSNSDAYLDFPEIYATNPPVNTPANCSTTGTVDTISGTSTSYTRTCTSTGLATSGDYSRITITVRVAWSRPGATSDTTCATQVDTCVTLSSLITNANPRYSGELS